MDGHESEDICWICLDDSAKRELVRPCACPRQVHPQCMARWQLQQAGRAEEKKCRFCQSTLADWKSSLTPEPLVAEVAKVQPIMVVYFEGEIHRIPVKQGDQGLSEFTNRIRNLFRLPEDVDISLTFGCKEPLSGRHLKLEGIGAFDAAVHCASVAAAERQQKVPSAGGADGDASSGTAAANPGTPATPATAAAVPPHTHCTPPPGAPPVAPDNNSPFMTGPWPSSGALPPEEQELLQQHLGGANASAPSLPPTPAQPQPQPQPYAAPATEQPAGLAMAPPAFTSQFVLPSLQAPAASSAQPQLSPDTPPATEPRTLRSQFSAATPTHSRLSSAPSDVILPTISGPGSLIGAALGDAPSLTPHDSVLGSLPTFGGNGSSALSANGGSLDSDVSSGSDLVSVAAPGSVVSSARRACRSASIADAPPAPNAADTSEREALAIPSREQHHADQVGCQGLSGSQHEDVHAHAGLGGNSGIYHDAFGHALGDEHGSISGRFRTGVKTLAKRLATSLSRVVHHTTEDHTRTCGWGSGGGSHLHHHTSAQHPQQQYGASGGGAMGVAAHASHAAAFGS